ncbi:hypothetical protein V5O48_016152 [Marasmius crinis-equi]|uniref:Uncharacterized protein n=1 Tax=Marasmius crinis-equi TaxID=585013 RepID=A0ABR3ESH0_9AGAR
MARTHTNMIYYYTHPHPHSQRSTRSTLAVRAIAPHLFHPSQNCRFVNGPSHLKIMFKPKGSFKKRRIQAVQDAENLTEGGEKRFTSPWMGNALVITHKDKSPLDPNCGPKVVGWQPEPEPEASPNLMGWSPSGAAPVPNMRSTTYMHTQPPPCPPQLVAAPFQPGCRMNVDEKKLQDRASQLTSVLGFTVGPTMAAAMAIGQTGMLRGWHC